MDREPFRETIYIEDPATSSKFRGPFRGLLEAKKRPCGRSARAQSVRVPSFSRDLLPKTAGLTRETVGNGSRPPLYIDEGLRPIETPNNRSNQVYYSFLPYALGVVLV
jgi:hypothetical protein